ncbi:MAG: amino acid racemase [Ekhidna sp.]
MKKLGLIGGTSWHSSIEYYRAINENVNEHFGDNTNPPLMLYNLNQSQIHRYQNEDRWDEIAKLLTQAALNLEKTGVEAVMFCANTPHKVYDAVSNAIHVPILHIADATSKAIAAKEINKVCFIGTKFTMRESYIADRISRKSIEVLVPKDDDKIEELHRIIQKELTYGVINASSKAYVVDVVNSMIQEGAEGIVLGCTEFPLMLNGKDFSVPIFNTTTIHAEEATAFVLNKDDK